MAFKIMDTDFYPKSLFHESVVTSFSPRKWWMIAEKKIPHEKNPPPNMFKLFSDLLSCPASSASIERLFSTFGLVWSKLRNKLGVDKAHKLVKVYRFLHGQPLDW